MNKSELEEIARIIGRLHGLIDGLHMFDNGKPMLSYEQIIKRVEEIKDQANLLLKKSDQSTIGDAKSALSNAVLGAIDAGMTTASIKLWAEALCNLHDYGSLEVPPKDKE